MRTLLQDSRYGARMLAKNPGFTAAAVLTLALGIGANTAIFSVIRQALLQRPPFRHLDRLVEISETNQQKGWDRVYPSPANFADWREQTKALDEMAAWRTWFHGLGDGTPEQVWGVRASANFFDLLGVQPALGRGFVSEEDQPGRDRVVLLSHGLWQRRYGGDAKIIGRKITIDGRPFTVVGVLPREFQFFRQFYDVWMPLALEPGMLQREEHSVLVFGRLRPGATVAEAQSETSAIAQRLARAYPATNGGWDVKIEKLYPYRPGNSTRRALVVLLAAVGFVLLIACANVANLLLARAVLRQREIAIRSALGATRGRLVRQLLTESLLLAIMAGAAGLLLAHWLIGPIAHLAPPLGTFVPADYRIDGQVLDFALLVSLATAVVFGLGPAIQLARGGLGALKIAAARRTRASASRLLVAFELALSMILLTGAGLLIKSFWHMQRFDPGFRPENLLTMQVWLAKTRYDSGPAVAGLFHNVLERVRALPGVESAAAVNFRPLLGWGDSTGFAIEGRAPGAPNEVIAASYRVVSGEYLRTMGIPLLRGRDLSERDVPESGGVVLINQAMARKFWPNEDPIGKRIRPGFSKSHAPWRPYAKDEWLTVVGVAGDVKDLADSRKSRPEMYLPYRQAPSPLMFLVARGSVPAARLAAAIEAELHAVDPDQPVSEVKTMEQAGAEAVAQPRFNMLLLGSFAVLAVALAAVGLYGVLSYSVAQRAHEIGIRMAVGAQPGDVLAMILRQSAALVAAGLAVGLLGSLATTRVLAGFLFDVSARDPAIFAGVALLLAAVALAACYVPARRATRVDPMITLRHE